MDIYRRSTTKLHFDVQFIIVLIVFRTVIFRFHLIICSSFRHVKSKIKAKKVCKPHFKMLVSAKGLLVLPHFSPLYLGEMGVQFPTLTKGKGA